MLFRKKAMAGIATLSLLALITVGTFAWTNFNSTIINEFSGTGSTSINAPGGTLHNDHIANSEDKHVYIENWGNEDLFVRIRLSEYMEMGSGAGLEAIIDPETGERIPNPENLSESLISGANLNDSDTWEPHIPSEDNAGLRQYWQWEMGGQKYYFPAPINRREDRSFIASGSPTDLTADSVNEAGVQAQQTRMAQVVTMADWMAAGSTIGDYWVIDSDGWAYWAAPLRPGDATGLLLNTVTLVSPPEKDYYYGIHVNAQMATKDLDELDNYRRFGDDEHGGWTADGQRLMDLIVGNPEVREIDSIVLSRSAHGGWVFMRYSVDFNERRMVTSGYPNPTSDEYVEFSVNYLTDEQIREFFVASARYGLENWGELYVDPDVDSGSQWRLRVEFSDSTVLNSFGSNKTPETWDGWFRALYNLTQ